MTKEIRKAKTNWNFLTFLHISGETIRFWLSLKESPRLSELHLNFGKKSAILTFFPAKLLVYELMSSILKVYTWNCQKLLPLTSSGDVPLSPRHLRSVLCTFNLRPVSCEYHSANSCTTCYELGLYPLSLRYFLILQKSL